ncbi:MAG: helix-turn-helix transcriptional regulator [Muribaculaceae bacterium]|nr:helix-turn-helix transcriptional regulator [Muribaculaceae bacterium]
MPTLITPDTRLSDVITRDPSTVTVLSRFGLRLGVGDLTVSGICRSRGINTALLTTILNTFLYEDYVPETAMIPSVTSELVDYLSQTNDYYERFLLPNIERHFQLLIGKSSGNNNLQLMLQFFHEVKQQLLERINDDRTRWQSGKLKNNPEDQHLSTEADNDTIEDKINDLVNMIVIHLQGDYDANLALAVLHAIVSLKKDITQNNRIRKRILHPLHHALTHQ